MIALYEQWAHKLYPKRRIFAAIALGAFAAVALLMFVAPRHVDVVGMAAFPIVTITWGLFCMCVWFEPERGNLQRGWLVQRFPKALKVALQWYFGVFLAFWFLLGIAGMPAFVLWGDKFTR